MRKSGSAFSQLATNFTEAPGLLKGAFLYALALGVLSALHSFVFPEPVYLVLKPYMANFSMSMFSFAVVATGLMIYDRANIRRITAMLFAIPIFAYFVVDTSSTLSSVSIAASFVRALLVVGASAFFITGLLARPEVKSFIKTDAGGGNAAPVVS